MAVGEVLLRANDYSWRAWPACSAQLGLTEADARATDHTVDGVFVQVRLRLDQASTTTRPLAARHALTVARQRRSARALAATAEHYGRSARAASASASADAVSSTCQGRAPAARRAVADGLRR